MNDTITFNKKKLRELKTAYAIANTVHAEQFEFEGHPILTSYAKYLIEYLENALRQSRRDS